MNCIIVGASSGLGLELARIYIGRGWNVGLAARRLDAIAALAAQAPGRVIAAAIDVDSPQAPVQLADLAERLGGLDLYVHVAGIGYDNPPLEPEREADIARTNCVGFARMISAAYCLMRDRGGRGHIAAVSSVAGTRGIGGMEAYSASKSFDQHYLEALRQRAHYEKQHIAVTDLRPGWTRTPLLKEGERYPLLMEPQRVVRAMVRAIDRRRRVATINRRWALLCSLWRLVPDAIYRCIHIS